MEIKNNLDGLTFDLIQSLREEIMGFKEQSKIQNEILKRLKDEFKRLEDVYQINYVEGFEEDFKIFIQDSTIFIEDFKIFKEYSTRFGDDLKVFKEKFMRLKNI